MKKILCLFAIVISNLLHAQTPVNYNGVLELLLNNNRAEARKQFDKQFSKTKNTNIDLLLLDAYIDEEMGKLFFDESFLKSIEALPNASYYITPLINDSQVLNDIKAESHNALSYKKIDFLSQSNSFKNLPIVQYRKGYYEWRRKMYDQSKATYKSINTIKDWQFCGVFESLNGSGLDVEYEPEHYAKNDKTFDANSNGFVGWYDPKYKQDNPYYFFSNEGQYGKGIIYAQTFIESKEKKEYLLSFGSSHGIKIFLNDKEIYLNSDILKTNFDAYSIKIPLEKGENRLLLKLEIGFDNDYFSAQIKNTDQSPTTDLTYTTQYKPYTIAQEEYAERPEVALDYEVYFNQLVKSQPNNIFYKLLQFKAYMSNNKRVRAYDAIEELETKYPNSSFLSGFLISYYNAMDDRAEKVNEILKNIENKDSDHYLNTVQKLVDQEWLKNTPLQELEKYRDKTKKYKQEYLSIMYDFIIASRNADVNGMFAMLEKIDEADFQNENLRMLTAGLYLKLKNDKDKYFSILQDIEKTKEIYELDDLLLNYYSDLNNKEAEQAIIDKRMKQYPHLNYIRTKKIKKLIQENKYDEAMQLVDENLANFPYSFTDMGEKGNIYSLQKKNKDAETFFKKSLVHNSNNESLRKQLYDLTRTPDEITEYGAKDLYKLAKERKKPSVTSDYGVSILLDEYIVNVLPEGGQKSRVTYLYEIVSDKGIEELKEYSINYSNSVLKSEIIKEDGKVVPAEKGDGVLVFPNLKVGDIISIQYENFNNDTGRFYKDFNIANNFNSSYPSQESVFILIAPSNLKYSTDLANGELTATTKVVGAKTIKTWRKSNVPALALLESYAPNYSDLTNKLQIGTIKSWSEISNWYADLVKKSLKVDKITQDTFAQIFPNGTKGLSQDEIALKIYTFIETNINYSSLDFRQSGHIPQKPSKTITTKLGDCKDVSTLFVALANMANLPANLVLVLTNDNASSTLNLPSIDFNHCIVKTQIDGKEYFIELTDKYLPFKALPVSLYHAKALVISFDKEINEKSKLISIPFDNALKNINKTTTTVAITESGKTFKNKHSIQGAKKSYYNEMFSDATTDDIRKKDFESYYNNQLGKVISLQEIKSTTKSLFDKELIYESTFTTPDVLKKVGNIKIIDIPFIDKAYSRDIISTETRNYDICYYNYEIYNAYDTEIILNIPEGKTFSEVPENKKLSYKGHTFEMQFDLLLKNSLKIIRKVTTPWETITTAEYPEYKKYVEQVIEQEEQVLGFK
ncbi:hypothetical protein FFWV33_19100 [Flavobacterium faecale]|uniref:Transglutaminase-like domain-containing protein n=1 Tax=Flavobacterium faecale TaxID=1355330 RepID=A0A2S1LIC9_9FLAO|nr:DUF3857 domain-containing protein [Flavobacterium faecale]AWG23489.1 hypothetical protein FFWV33_19100 [Flavobacterium faecale]